MACKAYITKREEELILACYPHVKAKSIALMLNMRYANVFYILCTKHGLSIGHNNPQRKYPYKHKNK